MTVGRKDDSGKLDITLLFDDLPHALEAVTEVLQWAITKKKPVPYERGSWQAVPDFQRRYRAAQLRHMLGQAKGRLAGRSDYSRDAETGLLELAHIATDAMFQLEMALRDTKPRAFNPDSSFEENTNYPIYESDLVYKDIGERYFKDLGIPEKGV